MECFKCHKKGHYSNKCPESKAKDGKAHIMKVRNIEDFGPKPKSIRQIRIRYSGIEEQNSDPFMRHWIIFKNLGQIRLGRIMRDTWQEFL